MIRGWEAATGQLGQNITARGTGLALNPAGTLLAFKKEMNSFVVADIFNAREVVQLPGQRPLLFSPDGRVLAVGSDGGVIALWGAINIFFSYC